MKFTDGYWLTRPSFSPLYAIEVDDIRLDEAAGTMSVYAPTAVIRERGDTLNRPMLTVVFSAPAPGVVKVHLEHHAGAVHRGPDFEIHATEGFVPTVRLDDEWGVLEAGSLSVRVARSGPWRVEFVSDGRVLTTSLPRSIGHMTGNGRPHTAIRPSGGDPTWLHQQLTIEPGERVYGLGERFGAFVKNGQTVDSWNADGGTSSEQSYKNVPFYVTSRGYGVFVDNPGNVSFELGSEVNSRVQFSVEGESLDYYVIDGPEPKDVLRRYTALTGRPARVPAWSFGLWLTTSFTASYDEDTVSAFVDGMAERDIPLSVFHYDCFWMREYQWTDFEWDSRAFHDPVGQIARMHERDVHVSVWINPYIAQRSALFREAAEHGYLLRRADGPGNTAGSVWQWDMWQAGMALVDFTNPAAADWYVGKLQGLLDQGVDTFKTDFGERIPVDGVVWHDGSDPQRMHNYYAKLYNEVVFRALERHKGVGNAVVFARSATAGSQQFPVHWGGDSDSTFLSMAESLRGGLSLAMSGFGYWSHDIGGFEGTPDPGLFKRWLAFGLLSSHSRLHGSSTVRVPWAFDDEAVDVAREFTKLKMRLMPYLAGAAEQAHTDGTPMMRPMVLEFPGDRSGFDADTQYMLGESLLVAPVFTADGTVEYYVPEGEWTSLLDGSIVDGRRWVTETHGYDSVPLRVRPGTVLPFGADDSRPDYDWADGVTLRCFALPDGYDAVTTVPGHDGSASTSFRVLREGRTITAISDDARAAWALQVGDRIVRGEASTLSLQLDLEEEAR